jgi:hypothetical protein
LRAIGITMEIKHRLNTHPTVGPYLKMQAIQLPVMITILINTLVQKEGRIVDRVLLI